MFGFGSNGRCSRRSSRRERSVVLNVNVQEGATRTGWSLLLLLTLLMGSAAQLHGQNRQQDIGVILSANGLAADGVTVTGTLASADTGDPIAGGHIFILNPGISPTGYAQ